MITSGASMYMLHYLSLLYSSLLFPYLSLSSLHFTHHIFNLFSFHSHYIISSHLILSSHSHSFSLGVREHCLFLKQIEDAASLRKAIAYCFERANIPSLSKQEVQDALSFVIVGAGPTGVSVSRYL